MGWGTAFMVGIGRPRPMADSRELVVIGSGIAGLFVALRAREEGLRPLVITKSALTDSATWYAQGGIAAAVGPGDTPRLHLHDTIRAGDGLVDREAAWALTREAPDRIADLVRFGVPFDTVEGRIALGREAAHSRARILHAGGDATGMKIEEALKARVGEGGIDVRENTALRALTSERGVLRSILVSSRRGEEEIDAERVVLATGGAGHLYHESTNPVIATGDGVALAFRAGARVRDMEFVQFHPTVLALEGKPRFLITEALRGEKAVVINREGERFMARYDPRGELAPRDVAARAITAELERTGERHVFLDARAIGADRLRVRFPTVVRTLATYGLDITKETIPVAPMAHYMMGGVATGLQGETSVRGLYAVGEVASSGIHGANRLASNSLLEGIVFGERIVLTLRDGRPWEGPSPPGRELILSPPARRRSSVGLLTPKGLGKLLSDHVGIIRTAAGLQQAVDRLTSDWSQVEFEAPEAPYPPAFANALLTSLLIARGALAREESRGGHYRTDFPRPRKIWRVHLGLRYAGGPATRVNLVRA